MLIRDSVFAWILYDRNKTCLPSINKRSVRSKRFWRKKSPEEMKAFSEKMSKTVKKSYDDHPHLRKQKAKTFKKVTKNYWKTVDKEKKAEHVQKMSSAMKKAWDEADENFGPMIANRENLEKMHNNVEFVHCKRINDYAGVITMSEMSNL